MKLKNIFFMLFFCAFQLSISAMNNTRYHGYWDRNIYQINSNSDRLLLESAETDDIDKAQYALNTGASFVAKTADYKTPLHIACSKGNHDIVQLLLEKKAPLEARAAWNFIPLHEATKAGDTAIVKMLIKAGSNMQALTELGKTPLHIAAQDNNVENGKYAH